jgi:hypothetical protein
MSWSFRTASAPSARTSARRHRNRGRSKARVVLSPDYLEKRQLMTLGNPFFIQGTVFLDAANVGSLQPGDPRFGGPPGALPSVKVDLYDSAGAFLEQVTTDTKGNYLFPDNALISTTPGLTYRVAEEVPAGYNLAARESKTALDTTSLMTFIPSTGPKAGASVDAIVVTFPNAPTEQITYLGPTLPGGNDITGFAFNGVPQEFGVHVGQMSLKVGPNTVTPVPSPQNIVSMCVDLLHDTSDNGVPIWTTTPQPTSTYFPATGGAIAYLYNTYGTSLVPGETIGLQSISQAQEDEGLQLAIWKLVYDGGSTNFSTGAITSDANTDPKALLAAQTFLTEAFTAVGGVGVDEQAVVLVTTPNASDGFLGQSALCTRSFNFGNTVNLKPNNGSISGTKFLDTTGNGLGPNYTPLPGDVPLGGVTIKLFAEKDNNNVLDAGDGAPIATAVTDPITGNYSFPNLAPGKYYVQEAVPNGYVMTGPVSISYYTVNLAKDQTVTGENFSDFQIDKCQIQCISYQINNCKTVSDLSGKVHQGDDVSVTFTVPKGVTDTVSLVSYTAPASSFSASTASQQVVFDMDTGTFGPGTYTLMVHIPNCYFQVDFVCGSVISQFGPAGSNIFYHAQQRFISGDNGGCNPCNPKTLFTDDTASTCFWASTSGLKLINSLNGGGATGTALASWLTNNYGNLFPASLIGSTNASVGAYIKGLQNNGKGTGLEAEALDLALSVYVTDVDLAGGTYGTDYGFNVSFNGLGAIMVNVGSAGSALGQGLSNNNSYSVLAILQAANSDAVNGTLFATNQTKRNAVTTLFGNILTTGSIPGGCGCTTPSPGKGSDNNND